MDAIVSIHENNSKYCPINWGNILPYDHRIKKIILLKMDNLFLYVGFSTDNQTIVYNEQFSKFILLNSILLGDKLIKADTFQDKGKVSQKTDIQKINGFLDIIKLKGLDSLTFGERRELDNLSESIN